MEPSMTQLELPAYEVLKALRIVRHAMTTSSDMSHMNGLLIKTRGDKINYVSTDGHWMLVVARRLEEEVDDHDIRMTSKTVHRLIDELEYIDGLEAVFRDTRGDDDESRIVFDVERKRYRHALGEITMNFDQATDPFVDYHRVVTGLKLESRNKSPITVGINPDLMRKVTQALNDKDGPGMNPVNMVVGEGPLDPIFLSSDNDPGVFAIVMPCTTDKTGGRLDDPTHVESPKIPDALITVT